MGIITDSNTKELLNASSYDSALLSDMIDDSFADAFDNLICSKGYSIQYIVSNAHISKTYINELRRRTPYKKSKKISREKLLEICLIIDATKEEIDSILKCANYQPLYSRNRTDSYIIWGLLHNLSGSDIKNNLYEQGFWNE